MQKQTHPPGLIYKHLSILRRLHSHYPNAGYPLSFRQKGHSFEAPFQRHLLMFQGRIPLHLYRRQKFRRQLHRKVLELTEQV